MKRSLFFIAMAWLAAVFPIESFAQDHGTDDKSKQTREDWQSRVNATRERIKQRREELRREREERLEPKREQLRLDRENRFGAKQEELKLDLEDRIGTKREELRRKRDEQKDLRRGVD